MGEFADFTNSGGRNGEGLYEREYKKPKMPKKGTYPTKWKPQSDPREGWTGLGRST
jgi:hypothetical protein